MPYPSKDAAISPGYPEAKEKSLAGKQREKKEVK